MGINTTSNSTDGNDYLFAEPDCCMDNIAQLKKGNKIYAPKYVMADLTGSLREASSDALKVGLITELPMGQDLFPQFIEFYRQWRPSLTLPQASTLFHASLSPAKYVIVTREPLVAAAAMKLSLKVISPDKLPLLHTNIPPNHQSVFRKEVDDKKVFARFRMIREEKNSPLKANSYWIVVEKVLRQYGWLLATQKAFIEEINTNFDLNPELSQSNIGYGGRQINSNVDDFNQWPNNNYKRFGYTVFNTFFGSKQPWGTSGLFVYEHEKDYTKGNVEIPHDK